MPIPKGLILYRPIRHQTNFLLNQKYGSYSDKFFVPFNSVKLLSLFLHRFKNKFAQKIHLITDDQTLETNQVIRVSSRYNHIQKCLIQPLSCFEDLPRPTKFTMKGFRRTFKSLRRIKELKLDLSGQFKGQACKNLLLLNKLETLSLPLFSYSEKSKNMDLFKSTVKLASKRRSWKHFKSLNIQLTSSEISHENPEDRSLQQLLEFMQDLKSHCRDIYKCSSFQLELPSSPKMSSDEAKMLIEISKVAPSITKIYGFEMKKFPRLSEMVRYSSGLKEISLTLDERFQHKLDLSVLNRMPNFQELALKVFKNQGMNLFLCQNILTQIQTLKNLTTLSLEFYIMPAIQADQKFELPRVISDLTNLKSLELVLGSSQDFDRFQPYCGLWLKDVFKAISEKYKLEKLMLSFSNFNFGRSSGSIFKNLCQSWQKLTGLSTFRLEIMAANTIGDEDILTLCQSLSKLTNIEGLGLLLSKPYYFKIKTFLALLDCLVNSFPCLSKLNLMIKSVRTTFESSQLLSEAINKMKCLNCFSLHLTGEIESDLDLKNLEAEMTKRRLCNISHSTSYQS